MVGSQLLLNAGLLLHYLGTCYFQTQLHPAQPVAAASGLQSKQTKQPREAL